MSMRCFSTGCKWFYVICLIYSLNFWLIVLKQSTDTQNIHQLWFKKSNIVHLIQKLQRRYWNYLLNWLRTARNAYILTNLVQMVFCCFVKHPKSSVSMVSILFMFKTVFFSHARLFILKTFFSCSLLKQS